MIHVHAFTLKYGCDVEYGNLVRLQKQPPCLAGFDFESKILQFSVQFFFRKQNEN